MLLWHKLMGNESESECKVTSLEYWDFFSLSLRHAAEANHINWFLKSLWCRFLLRSAFALGWCWCICLEGEGRGGGRSRRRPEHNGPREAPACGNRVPAGNRGGREVKGGSYLYISWHKGWAAGDGRTAEERDARAAAGPSPAPAPRKERVNQLRLHNMWERRRKVRENWRVFCGLMDMTWLNPKSNGP